MENNRFAKMFSKVLNEAKPLGRDIEAATTLPKVPLTSSDNPGSAELGQDLSATGNLENIKQQERDNLAKEIRQWVLSASELREQLNKTEGDAWVNQIIKAYDDPKATDSIRKQMTDVAVKISGLTERLNGIVNELSIVPSPASASEVQSTL